jgi:hypothetical protein
MAWRGKNIWLIPLLTAGVVALVGWWADGQLRRVVEQEVYNDLQTSLNANATALEIWMENQKRIAAALADEPRLKALVLELLTREPTNVAARAEQALLARQIITNERLVERVQLLGFANAQLVNTNLYIVNPDPRGRSRPGGRVPEELQPKYRELLETGKPLLITPFKPPRPELFRRNNNRPGPRPPNSNTNFPVPPNPPQAAMQVAAPIVDAAGHIQGILVLMINPDAEFTRILSVARSGESGETFAFDAEGVMLSESRFDDELRQFNLIENKPDSPTALNLRLQDPGGPIAEGYRPNTNSPLILMVERAITGQTGSDVEPFRDYRGAEVVGASRWLSKYGFGIGTKQDSREAFQALRVVRIVFLILFLVLLLATLVILAFSYSHILWRRRLTEAELKARQLGQYRLSEKIGEGGMGTVYKARHALLRRETALKLLTPDKADAFAIQRFEQEVQLTCRLTHPNTIQVFDYGHTPDGIFYYAMEFLDGLNLAELVARYGPQSEARVVHILRQVCASLSEAHRLGLIHRDIKPANVFLCDRGGVADQVKVLDFGLVKHFGPDAGQKNLAESASQDGIVGTPNFIAPETIQNPDHVDARSDLYSVGVLGYNLLTGQNIFEGASIAEVCRQHINDLPKPPGERIGKSFDAQLEAVIMRCLAKSPGDRPQSASELDELLSACPSASGWTERQRAAWWQSHRQSPAAPADARKADSTLPEHTVKIDFGERTP